MADQDEVPVPAHPWTATIFQLPPIDPEQLSGEDSVEITVRSRADGGVGMEKKTYRTTLSAILAIFAARRDNPNQVTAEQVGTLTVAQIEDLLKEKLGVEDVAIDALKLEGKTLQEVLDAAAAQVDDTYLKIDDFQSVMQNVTAGIDEITDSLLEPVAV